MFGIIATIGSAIGSVVSSAVSVASSWLGPMATIIGETVGKYLGPISSIFHSIGSVLGFLKPQDTPEVLGYKALKASEKPENFDSISAYIEHLREKIEIDQNEFDNANETTKLARQAVGMGITIKGIEENMSISIPIDFLLSIAKSNLTQNEVLKIIETYKQQGMDLKSFSDFTNGNLNYSDRVKNSNAIVEAYKHLEPNTPIDEIENRVFKMEGSK